jgi:hypothetical protein
MSKKETIPQQEQEPQQAPAQRIRNDWKTLVEKVSYKAIVQNVPYLAFVAVLCMFYINNTQRAVEMQRELTKQNKVLKELRWKYMDIKTQVMYVKMETQVIKRASYLGLKPLMLPAYTISTDTANTKQ